VTNIILLVKDRPRLTEQTYRTLYEETPRDQFNLVTVDDGSWPETSKIIERYARRDNHEVVTFLKSVSVVGFLRNVGVWTSERFFGRGEYLCTIDNDISFLSPYWLTKMEYAMSILHQPEGREDGKGYSLLGGYRHPFHGINHKSFHEGEFAGAQDTYVEETDAVAGYMHFMRWATWDLHGPYDQHAKGVCQSEDWALCQSIIRTGGHVGYVHPPVIANCGLTNSENQPAVGHGEFKRYPGLIYE
jgi:glycosyltransferase involved in cell wall biosynthesis